MQNVPLTNGFIETISKGWICPKCGFVYGPAVATCERCNKDLDNLDINKIDFQLNEYPNKFEIKNHKNYDE